MAAIRQRLWERVYNTIRRAIDQQRTGYEPGDALPYEHELADQHGVSRDTIRGALRQLEAEGLITPSNGPYGRYVARFEPLYWNLSRFELGDRRDDPDTGTDEWAADMKAQGRVPRQIVDVDDALLAPPEVTDILGVDPRAKLVRRRRLRLANDQPVSIADTWITEEVADLSCTYRDQQIQPFRHPEDIALEGGIIRALGLRQTLADDTIIVRHASPEEADLLQISAANTPVGEHVRVGLDPDERPVRVLRSVFPGNRLKLRYRLSYRN